MALGRLTESQLLRMHQFENDCDNSVCVTPDATSDPSMATFAVDSDFQQVVNVADRAG